MILLVAESGTAAQGLLLDLNSQTGVEEVEEGRGQVQELNGRAPEKGRLGLVRRQLVLQLEGVEPIFVGVGGLGGGGEVGSLLQGLSGARDASHGVQWLSVWMYAHVG